MGRLINWVTIAIVIALVVFIPIYAEHLTVRAFHAPQGEFVTPFDTKGGTVYVTPRELLLLNGATVAAFALVLARGAWILMFGKRKPKARGLLESLGDGSR